MASDSFEEFLRALDEHPEWRERLRNVVLTDRLLSLPDTVASLAEAQAATERRLETVATQLGTLAERVESLAERVESLAQRVESLAERVESLARAQERTEHQIGELVDQVRTVAGRTDRALGFMNEVRYRTNAPGYFGRIARRVRVLSHDELDDLLDAAAEAGALSEDDAQDLRRADAIMRGRREGEEVFLVMEASHAIALDDVTRAQQRAGLLAKTGVTAVAVVAGDWADPDTGEAARRLGVWQVTDGKVVPPAGAAA